MQYTIKPWAQMTVGLDQSLIVSSVVRESEGMGTPINL